LRSEKSGGLTKCEVCNDPITDLKDIELNTRVSHMMRKEARLRHLYNEFRLSRGQPAADFDILKFPNRSLTIQMCFICHLDAFANASTDINSQSNNLDEFNGGLLNQIGINTHYVREFGEKNIMMDTKRKFPVQTALNGHLFRLPNEIDLKEL